MPIISIDNNQGVLNFIDNLNLKLSKPQLSHLLNLMTGIVNIDGKRNISNISNKILQAKKRSCITKFLNNSPWDEDLLNNARIKYALQRISPKEEEPIFVAIDDTVIPKSKDTKHIEGLGYHFSHSEGKVLWSHYIVSSQVITEEHSFPLGFEQYLNKKYCTENQLEFNSKIDIACNLLELFHQFNNNKNHSIYFLTDSWFTSKKIIEKSLSYGYHLIGGVKTNRCIYPQGIKIKISDFVGYIEDNDLDVVTVKGKKYKVYRYEGGINGIDNAVVLICCEADSTVEKPTCIMSTDIELSTITILEYYSKRWNIETSFLYLKDRLGLKHYQMRKLKGLKRFWSIVYLAYTYVEVYRFRKSQEQKEFTLGDAIRSIKGVTFQDLIKFIYHKAANNVAIDELFKILKIAT